jgi:hypothetical protein
MHVVKRELPTWQVKTLPGLILVARQCDGRPLALSSSKHHWSTVTRLPGVLPVTLLAGESRAARHTGMYCNHHKLAAARFVV